MPVAAKPVLPQEMWLAVVGKQSTWDAACILNNIGYSRHGYFGALADRVKGAYKFACPTNRTVGKLPCSSQMCRDKIIPWSEKGLFTCFKHSSPRCRQCVPQWFRDTDYRSREAELAKAGSERARHARFGPIASEWDEMCSLNSEALIACERDYARYRNDTVQEEDHHIGGLFRHSIGVEYTTAGADEASAADGGAGSNSTASMAPVTGNEPTVDPPITGEPPVVVIPPGSGDAPHPPATEPLPNPVRNGDEFQVINSAAEAADPVDEVAKLGWFDYDSQAGVADSRGYAGLITRTEGEYHYKHNLSGQMMAEFPLMSDISDSIKYTTNAQLSYTLSCWWGIGPRKADSLMTQPGWRDDRQFMQWTTNGSPELLTCVNDTVMFNIAAGVSTSGRTLKMNTVFNAQELHTLRSRLTSSITADEYFSATLSFTLAGDNHIAFLVIAYTRVVASRIAFEQGQDTHVHMNGAVCNGILLRPAAPTPLNPFKEAVDAFLTFRPNGLITMPKDSSSSDIECMMYLSGHGRIIKQYQPAEGPEVAIFSPFDRFMADGTFRIAPLVGDQGVVPFPTGVLAFKLDHRHLEDLLTRYVNENRLWDQMAIARNQALAMLMSDAYSASTSLPKPSHARDTLLGTVNIGYDQSGSRSVLHHDDDMRVVLATGQWLTSSMSEALAESIVHTMETSTGVGPRAKQFHATVDTRQDDFGTDERMGLTTFPVVERFTNCPSTLIHQYTSTSHVHFTKMLMNGWETRPIRISSFLSVGVEPESPVLGLLFSSGRKSQIASRKYFTWRESVMSEYFFTSMTGPNPINKHYGIFYDDEISDARSFHPNKGTHGRNDIRFMHDAPQLWNMYAEGQPIKFITDVKLPVDVQEPSGVIMALASLRSSIEKAKSKGGCVDEFGDSMSDYSDDDEDDEAYGGANYAADRQHNITRTRSAVDKGKAPAKPSHTRQKSGGPEEDRVGSGSWSTVTRGARPDSRILVPTSVRALVNMYSSLPVERTIGGVDQHTIPKYKAPNGFSAPKTKPVSRYNEDEFLAAQMAIVKSEREDILRRMPEGHAEIKMVDACFPRGEDEHMKRAVYTIGNLASKVKYMPGLSEEQREDIGTFLINGQGGKNSWAVGVVMYILLNTLTPRCYKYLKEYGLLTTSYREWNAKWSAVNDVIRSRMDSEDWDHTDEDFVQCLYLGGLVGSPHRSSDWEAEVKKRSEPQPPLRKYGPQGFEDMGRDDVKEMIKDGLRAHATFRAKKVQSFKDVYLDRMVWMKAGSMSGEQTVMDTDPELKSKLESMGLKVSRNTTKLSVAERVDSDWMMSVLDMEPVHLAKVHDKKKENGKIRSIQASAYSHYVIGTYISMYLEKTMTLDSATMNKPNFQLLEEKETRRSASQDKESYKVCADYPDFGATHTGEQQEIMLECMLEVAVEQGFQPTEEFLRIHTWYKKSFLNQYWLQPDTKEWHRATTGMFSGVVFTTGFNTIMNVALRRHYVKTLSLMGCPITMRKNFELGDDGWNETVSREEAESYIAVIPLVGKELNPIKQLISRRGSEYLREWYMNGKVLGCPTRALAMLVGGNIESNSASAGKIRIRELYEGFATLAHRQFNRKLCQWLFEDLAVYEVRRGALGRRKVLTYLYTSAAHGGLALYPIYKMPFFPTNRSTGSGAYSESEAESEVDQVAKEILDAKAHNRFKGSKDYVSKVESDYGVTWKSRGKARAISTTAAGYIVSGNKNVDLQHAELELEVRLAEWNLSTWHRHADELQRAQLVSVSPRDVDKQYWKLSHEDQALLSELGQLVKITRFMDDQSVERIASRVAGRYMIPVTRVKQVMRYLSVLKGDTLEYTPTPYMSAEIMGMYTNWKVISKLDRGLTLPRWLPELAACYMS